MADVTCTGSLSASKGGASITVPSKTYTYTMVGADMSAGTQLIGTSEETIALSPDIGTIGKIMVYNMDATNFVWVYQLTGASTGRIKINPGDFCIFTPEATSVFAKADTASCNVFFGAVEL